MRANNRISHFPHLHFEGKINWNIFGRFSLILSLKHNATLSIEKNKKIRKIEKSKINDVFFHRFSFIKTWDYYAINFDNSKSDYQFVFNEIFLRSINSKCSCEKNNAIIFYHWGWREKIILKWKWSYCKNLRKNVENSDFSLNSESSFWAAVWTLLVYIML
jgi:hypothetical protein